MVGRGTLLTSIDPTVHVLARVNNNAMVWIKDRLASALMQERLGRYRGLIEFLQFE